MPSIRPATIDDAPALLAMITALARQHGDTAQLDAQSLARDVFCTPPWLSVLIADAPRPPDPSGSPQAGGYVACLPQAQLQWGLRGMEMHHLYVAADWRGTGLGRALVRAAASRARGQGCDYLSVGTHPDNHAAQGFYTHLGFQRQPGAAVRFLYRFS